MDAVIDARSGTRGRHSVGLNGRGLWMAPQCPDTIDPSWVCACQFWVKRTGGQMTRNCSRNQKKCSHASTDLSSGSLGSCAAVTRPMPYRCCNMRVAAPGAAVYQGENQPEGTSWRSCCGSPA